ncbi:MAG TPA: pyridoxine 5'-phosphate synthase [Kiritimatiellia bacterium]|nr:pyridoxine 5'-phosphate synthase [Kiritimatiellia bacterium]HMP00569.1 pyridoxine 5'-phosphate synthase [Kiritimatiellia bacterium]HMP97672.1 pyridoxine 5'-phosphate synthase [Kiritimatiellia bacterium]
MTTPLRLGVNIDHVATLRQARRAAYPEPVEAARLCAAAGAHGLTVHLREDRRHIQDRDVFALKEAAILPLNLEMGNHPEIVAIALEVRPDEACLVPEKRQELTTEGGLDAHGQFDAINETVQKLKEAGIIVSLFIDPEPKQIQAAALMGAPYIELHTGTYCDGGDPRELERLIAGAVLARQYGLKVNAGHGINLTNITGILRIPHLDTLNIGHSIVARAVMVGMEAATREMLHAMSAYVGGDASP